MVKILLVKMREALVSVLPVTAIVFLLNLTPWVNFSTTETVTFLLSSIFLVLGIGLFNLGADIAMTPMGVHVGSGLSKSGRIAVLLSVCFGLGVLITVAEPDLSVLAAQVSDVIHPTQLILFVGVGVGLFLLLAVLKIVAKVSLSRMLLFFYMMLFALAALLAVQGKAELLPVSFDSGGVTTGPITVPFIMALGTGIATTLGGKDAGENSFGLVALCSVGPILAVMMLGAFSGGELSAYAVPDYAVENHLGEQFVHTVVDIIGEVALALGLIVAFFFVLQWICLRLPRRKLLRMAVGIVYTFFGLVIFLSAVTIGFMPIGFKLGQQMAAVHPGVLVGFGFILGLVVVLAEPAVHVLNKQVEEITSGTVSKRAMMLALSIGVGVSIGLSMIRIIFDFSILYYLIPGYLVSLGLSFFVPRIYTAIAFDSGGVASGPLTSGFILPLAVGACAAIQPDRILSDAFGIVAMVAMTPLITIQIMGFRAIVARKVRDNIMMKNILGADDEQIIDFM
ncbi:MAG: DUF1538 domain-containing protein [Clostridia bacterium]|nr:DUF1538 domain-containing protein [Clostridia bacterium]